MQATTTNEVESHSILDLVGNALSNVKETISNLITADDKISESKDVLNNLNDHPQQTIADAQIDDVKISSEEVSQSTLLSSPDQSSVTDQKQVARIEEQLQVIADDYPWYTSHYLIVDAEARFAQFQQQSKPSIESLSLLTNIQSLAQSSETVTIQKKEAGNEDGQDDDGFQIKQRRKRIPSSTTHEKSTSSIIETTKGAISSDIDLTPVVLHGNPGASISHVPIVSQTTATAAPKKKRQKSKKNDKKEMILYDAPEPVMHIAPSQPAKDKQVQKTPNINSEDQKLETTSSQPKSVPIKDQTATKISTQQLQVMGDDYPWYTSHYSIVDAEARFAQFHQQPNRSNTPLFLVANVEIVNETSEKATTQRTEANEEQDQDHDGFQIVQRRKRIPSSTLHEKATSSIIETTKDPVSSDIDLTPVVLHGNPSAPSSHVPIISQTTDTTPRRKRKKSKKNDKKEMILYDAPELIMNTTQSQSVKDEEIQFTSTVNVEDQKIEDLVVETAPIQIDNQNEDKPSYQELQVMGDDYPWYTSHYSILDAEARFAQLQQQSNPSSNLLSLSANIQTVDQSSETVSTQKKVFDEERNQDDNDFQIVQRRKRIPSSTLHEKSTSSIIETTKGSVSSDIDLTPVVLYGNPSAPIPHVAIVSQTTDTTPKKKRKKSKKNEKQEMILYDAPDQTTNTTQSQSVQEEEVQLISTINTEDQKAEVVTDDTELIQINNQNENKSSSQQLQIIDDNYPLYTSHYPIVDAEAKFAQLQQQPNFSSEPLSQPPNVQSVHEPSEKTTTEKKELGEEHDQDDGDFRIVQRRKRIPSSTIHEKQMSSTIDTTKVPSSPDIDLTPVVLHGNLTTSIPQVPVVSQTTTAAPKKKRKKSKKNEKQEMLLYDAPDQTTSITSSQLVADEQIETMLTVDSEDQKVETKSSETKSTAIDDEKGVLSPTMQSTLLEHIPDYLALEEEQPVENEPIEQFAPSSTEETTRKATGTKLIPASKAQQEEEDNDGFQVVRYRGRILSVPKSEQTPSVAATTSTILDRDTEQKTSIVQEEPSASTPKNKGNKHKKQKKEVPLSNNTDSSKSEAEVNLQSAATPVPIVEVSNEPSHTIPSSTAATKSVLPKPSIHLDDEDEEEDNEGFQVVTHRKRITSAPRSANLPPSPSTKTRYDRHVNRNIDQKRVTFHGRHGSASPSVPHATTSNKTASNQNVRVKPTQDTRPTSSFHTPPRSSSVETPIIVTTSASDTLRIPKNIKPKTDQQQHVKDPKPAKEMAEQTLTTNQPLFTEPAIVTSAPDLMNTTVKQSTPEVDNVDRPLRIPAPQTLTLTNTVHTQQSEINTDNVRLSLAASIDSTPISVEETIEQSANTTIPQPSITASNDSSTADSPPTDCQNQQDSIQLTTPVLTVTEEPSKSSDNSADTVGDHPPTDQTEKEEASSMPAVESTITTDTIAKKPAKRRKKKSHIKEKSDDEPVLTTSTSTTINPSSNVIQTDSHTTETTSGSSHASTIVSEEVNSKLDLFLPEYIRQQINTPQPSSSLPTWSKTTSSDSTTKKKSRSKLLTKDHEAKSLLTNEFDPQTVSSEKSDISQSSPMDPESSLQSISSIASTSFDNSSSQSVDNILSRGFYLWLQESQALSQQKSAPSNIMQNIVFQSSEATEEDEDDQSWNSSQAKQSTYMTGIQANKQIHLMNAYSINHPHSISTPSWLIRQSHDKTFSDKLDTFDSGHEDDSFTDESKRSTDTQSDSSHQPTSSKFLQQTAAHSIEPHFDDWAHFFPNKTNHSLDDHLSRPLEYFYTQTFDDDTLLSNVIPNQHSMKSKQQRYGDFHPSTNNDPSIANRPSSQIKPSAYFQNSRFNFSHQTDDELLISHSSNGLSRRVGP